MKHIVIKIIVALLIVFALYILLKSDNLTMETIGEVKEAKCRTTSKDSIECDLIVTYMVDRKDVDAKTTANTEYEVGDAIKINYDPNDTDKIRVFTPPWKKILIVIFMIGLGSLMFIGHSLKESAATKSLDFEKTSLDFEATKTPLGSELTKTPSGFETTKTN